ncbi:MAG: glucose-6-phosphate dehydrogenase [Phycisphaeraceae bacterium]|nr:glucose-6-phosphate dehydrogenase [Phycisphaeraceae bacterium]
MTHLAPSKHPEPCVLVIFGASGDLTERKLIPSLYDMFREGSLPETFAVLGCARTGMSDAQFREKLREPAEKHAGAFDADSWDRFSRRVHYQPFDGSKTEDYRTLNERVELLALQHDLRGGANAGSSDPNVLFYLAVAPTLSKTIVAHLADTGLVTESKRWCAVNRGVTPWRRIIVEKPFGTDLESARSINRALGRAFDEDAIYRIDHYMGKELVRNVLVFRFANTIFEQVWNRDCVDHVQITAAETIGVEDRAAYYDESGAMRDMIQSHLVQVMTLIAMEAPSSAEADALARERIKVLESTRRIDPDKAHLFAAFGRYGAQGAHPAYTSEPGVVAAKKTETFCAMKCHIDNWRWAGVPFYLRSGKRMARKLTEIVVQFKHPPDWLFKTVEPYTKGVTRPPNRIIINIAPDEGISLRFETKVPGPKFRIDSAKMDMDYAKAFDAKPVEAYGPLILDAMRGDRLLFKHRDEVEGAWEVCQPLLDSEELRARIETYESGTWGPQSSDELLARDGKIWHNPIAGERR